MAARRPAPGIARVGRGRASGQLLLPFFLRFAARLLAPDAPPLNARL